MLGKFVPNNKPWNKIAFTREKHIKVAELPKAEQSFSSGRQEREQSQQISNLDSLEQTDSEDDKKESSTSSGPQSGSESTAPNQKGARDPTNWSSSPCMETLGEPQE